jgi:tetratricopeptide (TPR) repeat protein
MPVYDAFISYSHAKDKPLATALQSLMQALGKPWYGRQALWVFRDDTSLTATPRLWGSIEQALDNSRFFILMASPEAARSVWVGKEVAHWLATKSAETFLIALTAGDLTWDGEMADFAWSGNPPLPEALKGKLPAEPKWVDLRAFQDAKAVARDARFLDAAADLAAAVHGIPKENLLSRELQQQRRAFRQALAAGALFAMLAIFAALQWRQAVLQRDRAEQTLISATRGVDALVIDVAEKLRGAAGLPLVLVGQLLNDASGMLDQLHQHNAGSPALVRSQARALRETSQTLLAAGDAQRALDAAVKSGKLLGELSAADLRSPEVRSELSLSENRMGEALSRLGRNEYALRSFRTALTIREEIAQSDPSAATRGALALAYERTGDELFRSARENEKSEAAADYKKSYRLRDELAKAEPGNPDRQEELAVSYERLARVAADRGEDPLPLYKKIVSIREKLTAIPPRNARFLANLGTSYDAMGAILGCSPEGFDALNKALDIRHKLIAGTPDNADWQVQVAKSLERLASCGQNPKDYLIEANSILTQLDASGRLPEEIRPLRVDIEQRLQSTSETP